jgi:tetratricopeptide (TPR) repeat protein
MLDTGGRRLLARCSVFARGGNLEQLEAVCGPAEDVGGEVVEALDQLADQSLLRRLPDFDEPRFLMLQTIRDFAGERLEESGEAHAIRGRHLQAFIALVQQAQPHLFGPARKAWLDRLEEDHDNFRAALDWAVASKDPRSAMELSAGMWRFWQMRGHLHEGRRRMDGVLAMPDSADFPKERLAALEAAGGLAYWQADMPVAQRFYDECLALTRALGDDRALANALYNAAFPRVVSRAAIPEARPLLAEALPLFRKIGDETGVARVLWGTGNAMFFAKDYEDARPVLEEAVALNRAHDDRFGLGWSIHTLGLVMLNLGDAQRARACWLEAIGLFAAAGDVPGMVLQLDNFSALARKAGDFQRAGRLWAAASAHQMSSGTGLGGLLRQEEGRTGRDGLTENEAALAWAEGQAMSLDEAVAYALEIAPPESKERHG